ncbi:hypothetical protein SDJN03_27758, partial [Cucurbita argyrosperma subsp. sororia]
MELGIAYYEKALTVDNFCRHRQLALPGSVSFLVTHGCRERLQIPGTFPAISRAEKVNHSRNGDGLGGNIKEREGERNGAKGSDGGEGGCVDWFAWLGKRSGFTAALLVFVLITLP